MVDAGLDCWVVDGGCVRVVDVTVVCIVVAGDEAGCDGVGGVGEE